LNVLARLPDRFAILGDPNDPMTDTPASSGSTERAHASARVRISCPGCGRNDYVTWPSDRETYHWKCFNCGKQFDLTRDGGH